MTLDCLFCTSITPPTDTRDCTTPQELFCSLSLTLATRPESPLGRSRPAKGTATEAAARTDDAPPPRQILQAVLLAHSSNFCHLVGTRGTDHYDARERPRTHPPASLVARVVRGRVRAHKNSVRLARPRPCRRCSPSYPLSSLLPPFSPSLLHTSPTQA